MCASIPTVTLVTAMITRSLLCNSANSDSFFEVIMDKTKAQSEKKDEKQPKHKPGEDEKKSPKKAMITPVLSPVAVLIKRKNNTPLSPSSKL